MYSRPVLAARITRQPRVSACDPAGTTPPAARVPCYCLLLLRASTHKTLLLIEDRHLEGATKLVTSLPSFKSLAKSFDCCDIEMTSAG